MPRLATATAPTIDELLLAMAAGIEASVGVAPATPPSSALPPLWEPFPVQEGRGLVDIGTGQVVSPQEMARDSPADELLFGGAPGGGKTMLGLGLAITQHRNSAIFRRTFTQFRGGDGILAKGQEVIGLRGHFAGNAWTNIDGFRSLELLGCEHPRDWLKYRRPHDLKVFDELPEFGESMYRTLIGWLRTTYPGQRTRVVGTGNPPTSEESRWILRYWAPWLDPQHPNPAKSGELRWFIVDADGKDREVPGPTHGWERAPDVNIGTPERPRWVPPRSRTFVLARAEDNPLYMATGYTATLDNLPEPLRSQMRTGDFTVGIKDEEWQVIPTAWVLEAQRRWKPDGRADRTLSQVGNDPSRGGTDEFVIAKRYDDWVAPLVVHQAKEAPDGPTGARLLAKALLPDDNPPVPVHIDIGGSAGSSVYDQAKLLGLSAVALNGAERSKARDRSKRLKFVNKRAEWHWKMRELLDPAYGATLALPPDPQLRSDLCAPRWFMALGGIQVEDKDAIKKRIGRSPDRGEAVIYACTQSGGGPQALLFTAPAPETLRAERDIVAQLEAQLGIRPSKRNGGNGAD